MTVHFKLWHWNEILTLNKITTQTLLYGINLNCLEKELRSKTGFSFLGSLRRMFQTFKFAPSQVLSTNKDLFYFDFGSIIGILNLNVRRVH